MYLDENWHPFSDEKEKRCFMGVWKSCIKTCCSYSQAKMATSPHTHAKKTPGNPIFFSCILYSFPFVWKKTLLKQLGQHVGTAGLHYIAVDSMRSDDANKSMSTQIMSSISAELKNSYLQHQMVVAVQSTLCIHVYVHIKNSQTEWKTNSRMFFLVLQLLKEEHWACVRGYGANQGGDEGAGALRGAKRN